MRGLRIAVFAALLGCSSLLHGADRTQQPIVSRIRHETVESEGLAAIGYSKRLHALEIQFHHGGTYRYLDVPPSVLRELLASGSKAHYYNSCIRGKYRAVRVRPTALPAPNE